MYSEVTKGGEILSNVYKSLLTSPLCGNRSNVPSPVTRRGASSNLHRADRCMVLRAVPLLSTSALGHAARALPELFIRNLLTNGIFLLKEGVATCGVTLVRPMRIYDRFDFGQAR